MPKKEALNKEPMVDIDTSGESVDVELKDDNKNSDTIIAIVFIVINVILISGLSDKIYYH